jgi:hypothetical protein
LAKPEHGDADVAERVRLADQIAFFVQDESLFEVTDCCPVAALQVGGEAEVVQRASLAGLVTDLTEEGQGLLVVMVSGW